MKALARLLLRTILAIVIIVFTVILVRAFDSRRMPELEVWHQTVLPSEFKAEELTPNLTLEDYLAREERLFTELDERVYQQISHDERRELNRYSAGSRSDPNRYPQNWNRSFELHPDSVRGGVLLVHGLTDSPYSMRHVARIFQAQGFYVLALRMPGHGTVPAALAEAEWEDWMAAVRLGVRHVRSVVGAGAPLHMGGYSNGGALVLKYAMDSLSDEALETPDHLHLFSPMIGVSAFSRFASWNKLLSHMDYFEKFRWADIQPEYDPFKYNSFPKEAGHQTFRLTTAIQDQLASLGKAGKLAELPPILTFQSLVDSTVKTPAIIDSLYANLDADGSELVLFDMNRYSELQPFIRHLHERLIERLHKSDGLHYTLTLITNEDKRTLNVVAKTKSPRSSDVTQAALGLAWPFNLYSLSHIAVVFPGDDPLYGKVHGSVEDWPVHLGMMEPRGERGVLRVSITQLMRVRYNPFFDYLEQRLVFTI